MANTTISPGNVSNSSYQILQLSGMIYPKSPMPAWVPAVSVAVVMLVFLTISFYIRHRKVMKKRQILMDYFYIIFQYGGLRRKRMVTALCNTNAITLSHLGRSFMISFDSNENSCPFFTDETAFTKTNFSHSQSSGLAKAKSRIRSPFKRMMSQVEDGGNSVHDMLMKFKSKRKNANSASTSKYSLAPPRRNSLSSIHEDDSYTYSDRFNFETTPRFKQRRNAYIVRSSETDTSSTMDSEENELTNIFVEQNFSRGRSSVRRKSQIYHCVDKDEDGFRVVSPTSQNLRVLQLGSSTSRKHSQGSFHQNSKQGSKNEPLIFIQTASTDMSSSQESDEIPAHCSKGVMVLRKVSRDHSTGEQFYVHESPVKYNQHKRKSLSTVSYVQSSNVNDYYQHCLHSPKKTEDELDGGFAFEDEKQLNKPKGGRGWRKGGASKKHSPHKSAGPPQRRRTRLSLGDIGVGNFNFSRRIEESLGSMQEQDSEGSFAAKLSKDLSDEKSEKPKTSTTWRRLKNVFAGIRWSQTSNSNNSKLKHSKSSTSEDRGKSRNKRTNSGSGKLNRFFNVFTGFRSLPEDKKYSVSSPGGPKGSKSLPMGLDRHSFTIDDMEFRLAIAKHRKKNARSSSSSKADVMNEKSNRKVPPKTRSFPDNIYLFQEGDTKTTTPCLYHLHADSNVKASYQRCSRHKCRRRSERSEDNSKRCHSSSNIDFYHSPTHLSSFSESRNKPNCRRSGSTSPRSASPVAGNRDRRYRSLSPLPERHHFPSSPKRGKNVKWYSHSARNSLSERGNPMSPGVRFNLGGDSAFPFLGSIVKGTSLNLVHSCAKCSCEDLETTLLEVRTEQSCGESSPRTTVDFVTIDMEECLNHDADTTFINMENSNDNNLKDECCSVESDSVTTNTEFLSIDSQSKSSLRTHDKTNSSLDSIYFDTSSLPGSPMTMLRTNALKNSAASTTSLPADCGDTVTSKPSCIAIPSSDEFSPVPIDPQEDSKTITTSVPSAENNTPTSTSDICTYANQTPTVTNDSMSPDHKQTTLIDIDTLEDNTKTSLDQLDVIHETQAVIASSRDDSFVSGSEDTPVCTSNVCMDPSMDDELCDEKGPNADVFNEASVPLLRQSTLEKQSSITSEEDMMNITRLPRFGRRRSSQFTSPLFTEAKNEQHKQNDESPLLGSHSEI